MEAPPPTPQKTGGSCGIYAPLHRFLLGQTGERIVLPMKEIEAILGFPLPKSAYTYPMWYNPKGHPHCQAWLQAGYRVENVARCIKEKTITFVRK